MGKTTAYKLLYTFIYNQIDKKRQERIQKWLISSVDKTDKEEALESLWNEAEVSASESTSYSFNQTRRKIQQRTIQAPPTLFITRLLRVAAILLLPIIASTVTFLYIESTHHPVEMIECYIPNGEHKNFILPDGTEVVANSGSYLIYPDQFEGKTRTVYLQGEARFSVAKNKEKPFIVKTNHLSVEALGTEFNIRAYPGSDYTTATLKEGSIRVDIPQSNAASSLLQVNEQLIYYHFSKKVELATVDATKSTLWETGYLIFQEVPIEEIISTLERRYDVQINYDTEKLRGQLFYIEFSPDNTLKEALSVLEEVTGKISFNINKQD